MRDPKLHACVLFNELKCEIQFQLQLKCVLQSLKKLDTYKYVHIYAFIKVDVRSYEI